MDFDLNEKKEISEERKKVIELLNKYNKKFDEFDTWCINDKELLEILQNCLEQNKSYEEIYGEYETGNVEY